MRRPLVYTLAVLAAAGAGATGVFLVGSANRRSDRSAIVAYEKAVLPPIRDAGRIVEQEMKPTLGDIAEGRITDAELLARAAAWQRVFERARGEILALDPPGFLTDMEVKWRVAMDAYLEAVAAFEGIARAAPGDREGAINQAIERGDQADRLFDDAAGLIQFHRRRLGLGSSSNLPDPPRESL